MSDRLLLSHPEENTKTTKCLSLDADVHDYIHEKTPEFANKSAVVREALYWHAQIGEIEEIEENLEVIRENVDAPSPASSQIAAKKNISSSDPFDTSSSRKKRMKISLTQKAARIIEDNAPSSRKKAQVVNDAVRKFSKHEGFLNHVSRNLSTIAHAVSLDDEQEEQEEEQEVDSDEEEQEDDSEDVSECRVDDINWKDVRKTPNDYRQLISAVLRQRGVSADSRDELIEEVERVVEDADGFTLSQPSIESRAEELYDEFVDVSLVEEWIEREVDISDENPRGQRDYEKIVDALDDDYDPEYAHLHAESIIEQNELRGSLVSKINDFMRYLRNNYGEEIDI